MLQFTWKIELIYYKKFYDIKSLTKFSTLDEGVRGYAMQNTLKNKTA